MSDRVLLSVLGLAVAASVFGLVANAQAKEAQIITLTQTACQFIESENNVDHKFKSAKKADCEAVNARSGDERLGAAKVLTLKAGSYKFRVNNRDVPYELGFWLREKDYNWKNPLHKLSKLSVSGGGLHQGVTQDYEVELAPGEYLYSCPLNTTPDYKLVVTE